MRSTIIIILAISALYVSGGRVIKRQKKIGRVCKPACGCQSSALEFSPKALVEVVEAAYGLSSCGCPSVCNQHILLEEPCNYGYGIPIPAINLPTVPTYQCDFPSCQCQNTPYAFDSPCSKKTCDFNVVGAPGIPVETLLRTVYIETPRAAVKIPSCGCQMPVESGCQRQKCGCQLSALDVPCSCQMPAIGTSCGCILSGLDLPCGCQLPVFNLPCGCQLPGLDCGCQFQAFNSCACQMAGGPCNCQLPVPNVPYPYQLPSLDMPRACQLPVLESNCGCQIPGCGGQLTPPPVGCGKYLRQITLQPPCL